MTKSFTIIDFKVKPDHVSTAYYVSNGDHTVCVSGEITSYQCGSRFDVRMRNGSAKIEFSESKVLDSLTGPERGELAVAIKARLREWVENYLLNEYRKQVLLWKRSNRN